MLDGIAEALRTCRERAGLSQQAAAAAAGVNRVQLSYFESGRRQPPLGVAVTLACLYGTTLEDLLAGEEPERQAIDVRGVLTRAAPRRLGDQAQAGLALLGLRLREYTELADDAGVSLPGPGRSPLAPVRTASARDGAAAARDLRRHLHLGGGPVASPFRTLDDQMLTWRLPLGSDLGESPSGLFYNHPRAGFCVAVNSQLTPGRQVFTLAHALAHAYFHSHQADVVICLTAARDEREVFADAFAAEFLVPGDELRRAASRLETFGGPADPAAAVCLQHRFGVSFATLCVRLLQERLISRAEYEALAGISPGELARALGYPEHPADSGSVRMHPLDCLPARMLLLTRMAVERSVISGGDAAEVLGTSTEEVRELLARPSAGDDDRRLQRDLADAAAAVAGKP